MEDDQKLIQQTRAEGEVDSFRRDLGPFVVAAEKTRMPMIFTDAKVFDSPIIFANDAFLDLTGYHRDQVLGQTFNSLMAVGLSPEDVARVGNALTGDVYDGPELQLRRHDDSAIWSSFYVTPVYDERGRIVQHFMSFFDLTRFKQEQAHSQLLLEELNHRVKNILATVVSISSQAFMSSTDLDVIKNSIESRFLALSSSHDLLAQERWTGAGFLNVVNQALRPFGLVSEDAKRFGVVGENIRVTPRAALLFGFALHELATNALKYGALSNKAGSVRIAWNIQQHPDGDRLVLQWEERGGPPVAPPTRQGYGTLLIQQGLAYELGAETLLDYRSEGVVCTIDVPVSAATVERK